MQRKIKDNLFEYTPQKVALPTYDKSKSEVTLDGKTYNTKTGQVIAAVAAAAGAAVVSTATAKDVVVDTAKPTTSDATHYTCVWKSDLKRKILRGASCTQSGSRICSGYVDCEKSGIKFTRLATCGESLCGDSQAGDCSKQPGYGSRNPDGDDSSFTDAKVTKKVGVQK